MKTIFFIICFFFIFNPVLFGQNSTVEPVLTWSDEFDGTGAPDAAKWDRPEYNRRNNANGPDGWWSKDDSYLDGNGNLIIRVRKIENKNDDADPYDYSTGVVRTRGKFEQLYGKYEIRCQLPKQPGWWVAFWMMQGNVGSEANLGVDGSEVDIMEGFGWTDKINHAIHYDGYGAAHKSVGKNEMTAGIHDGFHTYSMEWTPEIYVFYIDDEEVWRSTGGGVCNQPGYVKVTGEISTEDWAINEWWSNNPETATYPDSFVVDYVRVYQMEYPDTTTSSNLFRKNFLQFYPNPVNERLHVTWEANSNENPQANIYLRNTLGIVKKEFLAVENHTNIDLSDLRKGVYVLSLQQNGKILNYRILKI
ncbi:MAG: family 16 glycosylhydrolase [Prolixibacteraceae bacterium]